MSEALSTAMLVLGEDVRKEIGAKLGLTDDQLDEVPMAIELSLPEVEGFTSSPVRLTVRTILTKSPAFRGLPPDSRKELAHNMVKVL